MKPLTRLFRFLKELIPRNSVSIPDMCPYCKYCGFVNHFENGLPSVYCNKYKCRITDKRLKRPIGGRMFAQYCSDFKSKKKK